LSGIGLFQVFLAQRRDFLHDGSSAAMKATAALAALFLMLGVFFCGAADEAKTPLKHKVAADFKTCPDGHAALKDIPIVWGLVGPLYKKPADYNAEDRKIAEQVAKGEIVLGNDIIPPNPPATRIVCQQRGFEFDPFPEDQSLDAWYKGKSSADAFKRPFSKLLLGFPKMEPVNGTVSYSQSLDAEGKVVRWEHFSFRTAFKIDQVLTTVRKWMTENGRDPKNLIRITNAAAYHCYDYSDNYVSLGVQDDTFWNPGQICVYLSLDPLEAGTPIHVRERQGLTPAGEAPGPPDPLAPPKKPTDEPKAPNP
jgi:hypothetical protein